MRLPEIYLMLKTVKTGIFIQNRSKIIKIISASYSFKHEKLLNGYPNKCVKEYCFIEFYTSRLFSGAVGFLCFFHESQHIFLIEK